MTPAPSNQPPLIKVTSLSKSFRIHTAPPQTIKTLLIQLISGKFSFGKTAEFSAIRNLDFSILPGEFVGIMGKNGAGKSTLLKIISGIYLPSSGSIEVRAAIAPMIELGAGFNPELTGYENIFLNAAVLGFGRQVTRAAVPSILEFSELGDLIHAPVRNYSSGMLVRLGFSIATHLEAPILLIDEILAVGDLSFQKKCLNKIKELHQKQGRTIILITHNPDAIREHCTRCLLIDQHALAFDGNPKEGAEQYEKLCSS